MSLSVRACLLGTIGAALFAGFVRAADEAPIPSTWKVQEISYSYLGFTTAYDCSSVEDKIEAILRKLGAHPNTKVRATGCPGNRPSRNFFITITLASPIPVADAKVSNAEKSKQELLKRLGTKSDFSSDEFPAVWKTVQLSKDRKLDIEPGDCELMEGLRDKVVPKLTAKIQSERIRCTPNALSLADPELNVSVLVPLESADMKKGEKAK